METKILFFIFLIISDIANCAMNSLAPIVAINDLGDTLIRSFSLSDPGREIINNGHILQFSNGSTTSLPDSRFLNYKLDEMVFITNCGLGFLTHPNNDVLKVSVCNHDYYIDIKDQSRFRIEVFSKYLGISSRMKNYGSKKIIHLINLETGEQNKKEFFWEVSRDYVPIDYFQMLSDGDIVAISIIYRYYGNKLNLIYIGKDGTTHTNDGESGDDFFYDEVTGKTYIGSKIIGDGVGVGYSLKEINRKGKIVNSYEYKDGYYQYAALFVSDGKVMMMATGENRRGNGVENTYYLKMPKLSESFSNATTLDSAKFYANIGSEIRFNAFEGQSSKWILLDQPLYDNRCRYFKVNINKAQFQSVAEAQCRYPY